VLDRAENEGPRGEDPTGIRVPLVGLCCPIFHVPIPHIISLSHAMKWGTEPLSNGFISI